MEAVRTSDTSVYSYETTRRQKAVIFTFAAMRIWNLTLTTE
jgi:hypothetical protein